MTEYNAFNREESIRKSSSIQVGITGVPGPLESLLSCKGGDGLVSKTFFGSRLLVKLVILNVNSAPFCYALTFFFSPPYFAFAL